MKTNGEDYTSNVFVCLLFLLSVDLNLSGARLDQPSKEIYSNQLQNQEHNCNTWELFVHTFLIIY